MNYAPATSPAPAVTHARRIPTVAWVVTNLIHYHAARMEAVAAAGDLRPVVIELSDRDAFPALECGATEAAYDRHTLFPGTPLPDIDGRAMAAALHQCLDAVAPQAVCINGWSRGGCIAALAWCVSRRVPVVVMSDSNVFDAPRKAVLEHVKRRIVHLCGAALVAGTPQAEYLEMLGMPRQRIFHGYDVVDNAHFAAGATAARRCAASVRAGLGLPERYVLAVSRMIERKNLLRLLDAYAAYRWSTAAGAPPWSLVIAGDGPQRAEIEERIAALGLTEHVTLPGFLDYQTVPLYYGLAEAFIHASRVDQWGLVVNEAMAAGLPVLVSRACGCTRDLVQPGTTGFVFDPDDTQAMTAALAAAAAMTEAERGAMGAAAARRIDDFSLRTFCGGLREAVAAASAAPPPRPTLADRLLLKALSGR